MKNHFAVLTLSTICALALPVLADDAPAPAASGTTTATPAPGRGGAGRFSPEERLKRLTETLGLTQDQQDKIKAIYEKNAPQLRELMSKGRNNLSEDDKTKLRELLKSQTEDIAAVLTPEQKEKFKTEMEQRRQRGGAGAPPAADANK